MKTAFAAALFIMATSAAGQIVEGDAIKPAADAMRAAWKASPKKPVAVTIPLYDQILSFDMLRNFVPAYQVQNDHSFVMEYLPNGQNFDNWTEMVTVTAVKGGAQSDLTHVELVEQLFDTLQGCNRGLRYRSMRSASADGVSAIVVNRSCAHVELGAYAGAKSIGEQNLIVHMRDRSNSYSVQYSTRRQFKNDNPPFSDIAVEPQLGRFGEITLCRSGKVCSARFSYKKASK